MPIPAHLPALLSLFFNAPLLQPRLQPAPSVYLIQDDEFSMLWSEVWKSYFQDEDEMDEFMSWMITTGACKRPKRLAVEEASGLLVCAKPCKEDFYPVMMLSKRKRRRVRTCRRAAAPTTPRRTETWGAPSS